MIILGKSIDLKKNKKERERLEKNTEILLKREGDNIVLPSSNQIFDISRYERG